MAKRTATRKHHSKRRFALEMQQPIRRSTLIDRIVFLFGAASAGWLAVLFAIQGVKNPWAMLLFIPVWAMAAYFVLPRLHKLLSDLYVPDYFFGRTRTGDGLLGDPVNLGVDGSLKQLDAVMREAGWHKAEEVNLHTSWKIIVSTLTRRSYPTAPVSPLFLFGRRHNVAYQQEVAGNPKQRHHVRFWHCPPGWLLPGGAKTDWLGAGTYDTDIGLSLFTLQVTHRIDENTDEERDYVVSSMQKADKKVGLRVLKDFTTGYHARNGGGDRFITDGNLPIVDVSHIPAPKQKAAKATPKPPLSVIAATALITLSAILDTILFFRSSDIRSLLDGSSSDAYVSAGLVYGIWIALSLAQVVMAWLVLRGGRRSRWILIILLVISIVTTAFSYLGDEINIGFNSTLLSASLMSLALISLSSESASMWSRRRKLAGKK